MKIEKLTAEQEKELSVFREEWLKHGLSCEPTNNKEMERAITEIYKLLGKDKPIFWYFHSPLSCQLIINLFPKLKELTKDLAANLWDNLGDNLWANLGDNLRANLWANLRANLRDNLWDNLGANLGDNLRDSLWANLGDNLDANLGANLRANLWANLRDSLWANLWANLEANLGANLRANLWANLRANLWANLGDNLRANLGANLWANLWANLRANLGANLWANLGDNLWANLGDNLGDNLRYETVSSFGQIDSYWIAYYLFGEKIGVKYSDQNRTLLYLWADQARSGFWWWAFENHCFISRRPVAIHKNEIGRLHADGKLACEFKDGWGVYYYEGVRLPYKYGSVKSQNWKSEWILKEENAELKMTLIKGIGYEKMCQDLEAKKIDSWREYELLRIENVDVEPIQLNKMTCPSTGKIHVHRVPPDIKTAREAIRWSNLGIDAENFSIEH